MKKLKVVTLVGTRPEIIRLSRVIARLNDAVEHVLVHTGQNYDYELNQVFFDDLEISEPDHYLDASAGTVAEMLGNIISRSDAVLEKINPDALLILGDTNSALAAIAAKRRKIPVFHMEAGNRCFDERVPEELNRRIVDHISDINMPYSDIAREYLLREGIAPDRIVKTGSPMYEVLHYYSDRIESSAALDELKLEKNDYFVVSCHREENVDAEENVTRLAHLLNHVAAEYGKPVIFSVHPRTRKRFETLGISMHESVNLVKPLSFTDYVHLQKYAYAVLSDSGTITEESSILDFPALNIREAHERPEGMEEGAVMMTGFDIGLVEQGLSILCRQRDSEKRLLRMVSDYEAPEVSEKVVRTIVSYTDYVNRKVWYK